MISLLEDGTTKLLKSQVTIATLADALREVIQNSLDARATEVSINVDTKTLAFNVVDNGIGISPLDLDLIATRYYTSKLKSLDQLKKVKTFGFRGEALNSLSLISKLTIVSKDEDHNASYYTKILYGKKQSSSKIVEEDSQLLGPVTTLSGTNITVSGLFGNVPVRSENLSKSSENKVLDELRAIVLQSVISSPSLKISLYKKTGEQRQIICQHSLKSNESDETSIISALSSIYGISIRNNSNTVEVKYKDYMVRGLISTIPVQSKGFQYIYWNSRILNNAVLNKKVNKLFSDAGFGSQSDKILVSSISRADISPKKGKSSTRPATIIGNPYSKHPVVILKIRGPNSISDLMQNPSKSVELSKHLGVIEPLVVKVIKGFLKLNRYKVINDNNLLEELNLSSEKSINSISKAGSSLLVHSKLKMGRILKKEMNGMASLKRIDHSQHNNMRTNEPLVEELVKRRRLISEEEIKCCGYDSASGIHFDSSKVVKINRAVLENSSVISQIDKKFILVKMKSTLYVIDQHACDERIKVECILKDFICRAKNPSVDLSVPLTPLCMSFGVSAQEFGFFEDYKSEFAIWGIKYQLKDNNVTVSHLPELLHVKIDADFEFIKKCLIQYGYDLYYKRKLKLMDSKESWWLSLHSVPTVIVDLINSKACRRAIMFGSKLTKTECENLVRQLLNCKYPFQCAHGRPSIVPVCDISKLI
ncbi:hypothetical protein WICMUC_001398 [Wickerhamomyces mucosus]|uniref:MutL C-terminal dimerisation domain-containing protein n=1 Tax=Wickerhamomyces mucosus TaxID=1378264 RepID=A0A9P8THB9_9ASCO|nr:hypothetical protein WICMUC_001398 [Wickerhamomyces mucosus]